MGNSSLNTGRPKFGKLFYKNWSLSTDLLQRQKATRKWPSIASLQAFRTSTRFARSGSLPFPSPSDACHPPATHATRSREINILTVFDVKSMFLNLPFFWVSEREIDILTVLDVKSSFFFILGVAWNQHSPVLLVSTQHPCCHPLNVKSICQPFWTGNQHFCSLGVAWNQHSVVF